MMVPDVCPVTTTGVLRKAAFTAPDVEAVVCGTDRITFSHLAEHVDAIKRGLLNLGVAAGDHVAVCVGNGSRWVELFYAITGVGAVVIPVNTRYRGEEMRHVLEQSQTRFLFTATKFLSSDFRGLLREIAPALDDQLPDAGLPNLRRVVFTDGDEVPRGAMSWQDFLNAPDRPERPPTPQSVRESATEPEPGPGPSPDDVALIQYTSGTTSRPKGVLLTHRSMCLDAYFSGTRMGLRLGDRFHSVRPFFHVAGSTLSVLASAQCLSTLVTMPRFEPGPALEVLEAERCTHFSGNDTIALMLLSHPDRSHRRLVLRGAWVAAAPAIVRRVIDELGAREAVVGYGLSEAAPNVAQSAWYEARELRVSGAMLPEPGVSVRIWDLVDDELCATGEHGEIQVRGWNVMQGYFDEPEQTARAFTPDGWLKTGDIGVGDESGRIQFVGRAKDLIRVGGENVAPAEIEDVLHRHHDVKQAVVVGVPDERLVEVPFAFVVLNDRCVCSEIELRDWVKARISGFKVPRYVRIVQGFEQIGMTASSKIQKNKLAAYAVSVLDVAS